MYFLSFDLEFVGCGQTSAPIVMQYNLQATQEIMVITFGLWRPGGLG